MKAIKTIKSSLIVLLTIILIALLSIILHNTRYDVIPIYSYNISGSFEGFFDGSLSGSLLFHDNSKTDGGVGGDIDCYTCGRIVKFIKFDKWTGSYEQIVRKR